MTIDPHKPAGRGFDGTGGGNTFAMSIAESFHRVQVAYAEDERRPLFGYLASLCTFGALAGIATAAGRRRGTRLPERFTAGDTVLLAVATHKASRLLTKSSITSVLRAPFTRYEQPAGAAEVNESVRGHGVRHAAGELMTCPFCSGVWVASALTAGLVLAPKATRLVTTTLSAVAASDWLHLAYDASK
ncbi:DUF1360 domain-containing protein [Lentzea flaviverrucosa]|uniref:DUF1360 domain-containing protein n=1 Tax=Lentzea flaviverrucosa TaxID=200379 RepID=A0A1H9XW45_9PSEU|nr:uncharacterized protein DUF1360 [Lentzea flaviverrucosa]SES50361.1 Protein of unknown function [Lentzea flaviverrucosa]